MMKLKLSFLFFLLCHVTFAQTKKLLIGTYGNKGIYVYNFNSKTGETQWVNNTENLVNPSYLTVSPDEKFIYSVNETGGNTPGKVSALTFDKNSGKINLMNQQLSGGDHPCYISIDNSQKWVIVGNYSGGNLSVFPLNSDGTLQPLAQLVQHEGSSIVKNRQEKPHVHAAVFTPDQQYLLIPDLGIDKVMIYPFNPSREQPLQVSNKDFAKSEAGSGPRHITFHPNNKFAYLIEELSGTVTAYHFQNGKLNFLQRIAAHPDEYKGVIGSADIHVSPDGKFLYASNRGGENTIAIFAINKKTGKLTSKGYQSTLGKTPRNFTIDSSGNFLLVANQDSNNVVIFKRNKKTGLLHPSGNQIQLEEGKPVFLKILEP